MRLAARGRRESEGGEQAVADPWLVGQLRRQAKEIHIESLLTGIGLTGLALLVPA